MLQVYEGIRADFGGRISLADLIVLGGSQTVSASFRDLDMTSGYLQAPPTRVGVRAAMEGAEAPLRGFNSGLAQAALEKFGGDSITETVRNKDAYMAAIPDNLRTSSVLADPSDLAALDEVRGDLS